MSDEYERVIHTTKGDFYIFTQGQLKRKKLDELRSLCKLYKLSCSGVKKDDIIKRIIEQIDNKIFKNIIIDIKEKIEGGSSFSNTLAQHGDLFSEIIK